MVVWVFAGGGESEVIGLIPWLKAQFPHLLFERKTPISNKPGPKPRRKREPQGRTGRNFTKQLKDILAKSYKFNETCQAILIVDDLDCKPEAPVRRQFTTAVEKIKQEAQSDAELLIALAAPEIEVWLLADWEATFKVASGFKAHQSTLEHVLAKDYGVRFETPEQWSSFDKAKKSCKEKLSDAIIAASQKVEGCPTYKKSLHTPTMLSKARFQKVANKCPAAAKALRALEKLG